MYVFVNVWITGHLWEWLAAVIIIIVLFPCLEAVKLQQTSFVIFFLSTLLIENGKITVPVKGATLIGNGLEVLNKVSMVGNDLALDSGIGVCGKDGQSVPVGVGQPTVKLDILTVGGTKVE